MRRKLSAVVAVALVGVVGYAAQPSETVRAEIEVRPSVKPWPIRGDWAPVQTILDERAAQEAAEAARVAQEAAEAERQAQEALRASQPRSVAVVSTGGSCPGSIPGYLIYCESKCDPRAQNPGSTASGKYQALNSTWDGFAGYARAADAPESVQDEWAAQAYAARGTQPWAACGG